MPRSDETFPNQNPPAPAAGYPDLMSDSRAGRLRRRGAVTALVVLGATAVGIWVLLRTSMPATVGPPDIRPITSDEVPADLPIILAWEGGGPPYRVRLTDEAGETVWYSPKLARALVVIPRGLRRGLSAGSSYHWSVEGRDLRGKPYRSQAFPLRLALPSSVPAPVPG